MVLLEDSTTDGDTLPMPETYFPSDTRISSSF